MGQMKVAVLGLAAAALIMRALPATAQATHDEQTNSLRGLQRVVVVIPAIDEDAERDGLRRTDVQTDVEIALRLAGIRVSTVAESGDIGCGYLRVNVLAMSLGGTADIASFYVYTISVRLFQDARLLNTPRVSSVMTWEGHTDMGSRKAANLRSAVRESVKDRINEFINDWLAVHPKT